MTIYRISHIIGTDGKPQTIRELIHSDPVPKRSIRQKTVIKIPGKASQVSTVAITKAEIAEEICKIPRGKVVSITDLKKQLAQKHNVENIKYESDNWPVFFHGAWIPYWRVVSPTGYVGYCGLIDREGARSALEDEGVLLEPSRHSYRVTELEKYRYHFGGMETTA